MASEFFLYSAADGFHSIQLKLPEMIDPLEFDRLNDSLLETLAADPTGAWLLDLTDVTYMGSAILGLMVNIRQRVKQSGGTLVLCAMSPRLTQIFRTCSLERLFVIAPDRNGAMKLLGRKS